VIARPLIVEEDFFAPRVATRSGRGAASRRRVRTKRQRYEAMLRIVVVVGVVTLAVVTYLALLANVTGMTYELAKSARDKARLQDVSARLDDRIARLASRDRLAQLAAQIGMRDPQTFAVVQSPAEPKAPPAGVAFLRWLK